MRFLLELFCVVALGLLLGGGLSWYSIQNRHGFGSLTIDRWTAWPQAGSPDADPYTKAKVASDGEVPLDSAEGVEFVARDDAQGQRLSRNCSYRLMGKTPVARLWTLAAHGEDGRTLFGSDGKPSVVVSRNMTYDQEGSVSIGVSPMLASGNWLPISGSGPFNLVFRLYDAQIINDRGLVRPQMPVIARQDCV